MKFLRENTTAIIVNLDFYFISGLTIVNMMYLFYCITRLFS